MCSSSKNIVGNVLKQLKRDILKMYNNDEACDEQRQRNELVSLENRLCTLGMLQSGIESLLEERQILEVQYRATKMMKGCQKLSHVK